MARIKNANISIDAQLRHLRFLRTWSHRYEMQLSVDVQKTYGHLAEAFSDQTLSDLSADFILHVLRKPILDRFDSAAGDGKHLPNEEEGVGAFRGQDASAHWMRYGDTGASDAGMSMTEWLDAARERARKREKENPYTSSDSFMDFDRGRMLKGFDALRQVVFKIHRVNAGAGLGHWGEIKTLRLNDYMPRMPGGGKSRYNNLFYAVEFGTGVAENVGGSQFVRTEGSTKHPAIKGAWRYGPKSGGGWLYTGQKAFHFLYEPRQRKRIPRIEYRRILQANFATYARSWYAQKFRMRG